MAHPPGSRVRTTNDEQHEWFFFACRQFYTVVLKPYRTKMATNPLAGSFLRKPLLRAAALLQSYSHLWDDAQSSTLLLSPPTQLVNPSPTKTCGCLYLNPIHSQFQLAQQQALLSQSPATMAYLYGIFCLLRLIYTQPR